MSLSGSLVSPVGSIAGGSGIIGTGSRAVVSAASGTLTAAATTATEVGYVNGVTSALQTQLNNKAWVFIGSATPSAAASVAFTSLSSTYFVYKIEIANLKPTTDNVNLILRTSTDNGSSYDNGASDYSWGYMHAKLTSTTGFAGLGDEADTAIRLFTGQGNGANEGLASEIIIFNPSVANYCLIQYQGLYGDSTDGLFIRVMGSGVRLATTDVDAVQILYSSDTIASGEVRLYGLRA